MICMQNFGSFFLFLFLRNICMTILLVLFLFFQPYKNFKMSDETYVSFRVEFLHDERGTLIKEDTLFHNIYDFQECIHCKGFIKCKIWYHPKAAKLEKVLRKKWEKTKDLLIINVLLRRIKEGDAAFYPTDYLTKDEEQYFQILQQWKIDFEKKYLEKYPFLIHPPIRHKKILMKAPIPNIR